MRISLRTFAVVAVVALWAGKALAVDVDLNNTQTRLVALQVEDSFCAFFPFTASPPAPTDPELPNIQPGDAACEVFANDGNADFSDTTNDFYGTLSTSDGGTNWNISIDDVVWAQVLMAVLDEAGAILTSIDESFSLNFHVSGAVTPGNASGKYWQATALFGAIPIDLSGDPVAADRAFFGQAVNPLDPNGKGIPFVFSCGANPESPNNPLASGTQDGAATTNVLTDSGQTWTVDQFQNLYVKLSSGEIQSIVSNTADTITLRVAVTVADGEAFDVIEPSVGPLGPPQPGLGTGEVCDNLIPQPGFAGTALTALQASITDSLLFGGISPAWTPLDWRLQEIPDTDNDGAQDVVDNCILVPQDTDVIPFCDTDNDGYGNACDGDFNQDNLVTGPDFNPLFLADGAAGMDSGIGTDMNCDGLVTGPDFNPLFLGQAAQGLPGPSGLPCAGTVPCPPTFP